ncbi:MAG TPA: membrane protein insertase YidC [Flavobacteriia bacterium]|nr:membrane protein insertase YidC [Flavobacteriia bacterium]
MNEKKFDYNSLIGMVLFGILAFVWIYNNQPSPEEIAKQKEMQRLDSIKKVTLDNTKQIDSIPLAKIERTDVTLDSTQVANFIGTFEYAKTLPSAINKETSLKNEVLEIKINNLGGQITSLQLLKYLTWDKKPLYLIKDKNALLNLTFYTKDGKKINTKDMFFEPSLQQDGENQILSMKLKISDSQYLEYTYTLKPNDYMLDFNIKSHGLSSILNTSEKVNLDWLLKAIRTEKSIKYENQYTELDFMYDSDQFDYLSAMSKEDKEEVKNLNWIAYKKQFFSSILTAKTKPFDKATLISKNLVQDEDIDTIYTKQFKSRIELNTANNEINKEMQMYYGPTDYKILKTYKNYNFERLTLQGWAIIRGINKYLIMPIFNFYHRYIGNLGLVIILLTITIKLLMSPLLYKSFLSSAKMKVIKPEIQELNDKYKGKENAMKRQQEVMALQRKAGVNPMAGCIPALLQAPIFFALFRFFPTNIDLRQKSFLWVNDLSAYDEIAKLPFRIPVYGDHIALFPILASITMYFYMKLTQGQQADMQQPAQEGMPDMQKMMKMMLYLSPIMMLVFFNSYGSGLSIYYFVSQLISIVIMLVIKNYIIDEKKIHALIQENKKKAPKKKSKFRQRLDEAMKQAQEQQEKNKKK